MGKVIKTIITLIALWFITIITVGMFVPRHIDIEWTLSKEYLKNVYEANKQNEIEFEKLINDQHLYLSGSRSQYTATISGNIVTVKPKYNSRHYHPQLIYRILTLNFSRRPNPTFTIDLNGNGNINEVHNVE